MSYLEFPPIFGEGLDLFLSSSPPVDSGPVSLTRPVQLELDFDPDPWSWGPMIDHPEIPLLAVTIYAALVFIYPRFRPPIRKADPEFSQWSQSAWYRGLKRAEVVWNTSLALFSTFGLMRVLPRLTSNLRVFGLEYTVCSPARPAYGVGAAGFSVFLFIMSKFVELGDTMFMLLMRKDVAFLQWYHHITVLLYCWHSYITKSGNGIWFATMNLFVHSLMYTYFALVGMGFQPKWNMALTVLQISQMFVGIAITLTALWYHRRFTSGFGNPCAVEMQNIQAGLLMYFSYFVLFCQYFYERYLKPVPRGAKRKAE